MTGSRSEREPEAERRRRMAAAFGDPLPDSTRDESPESWGEADSSGAGSRDDEWLRGQVPPHHG